MSQHLRPDLAVIAEAIAPGARVLDIGCGDGALLKTLRDSKNVDARGMDIDAEQVAGCVAHGLSVVQGDANRDLAEYPDASFDYAVLSQTLPMAKRPDLMLDELLRVGREAFVSFPNFAHWRTRAALLLGGRMPVTRALPLTWYETRNIHHVTVDDFRELTRLKGCDIRGCWFFAGERSLSATAANLRAEFAVFHLAR